MTNQGHSNKPRIPGEMVAMDMRLTPLDNSNSKPTLQKPIINDAQNNKWAIWGDGDTWPYDFILKISKSGVALTGIDTNADMHYGNGMVWTKDTVDDEDNSKLVRVPSNPEGWEEFCRNSNFTQTLIDAIHSLETFYIAFIEVILTKDKKGVAYSQILDPVYCRKQVRTESGKTDRIYYSPDFSTSTPVKPDEIMLYNPDDPTKHDKFIIILEYSTYARNYYPSPNLQSVIDNGWMDIAISVPKYIKSIYANQISPKYQITIPIEHFRLLYKDWDQKSEAEQLTIVTEKKTAIEDSLIGEENSAKSFISIYDGMKENQVIEITPIASPTDTVKDKELPNNAIANAEICTALGIPPALGGITIPGGSNLSGSGSDVRENRKSKQANLKSQREKSLQFAKVVAMINGYPTDIYPSYIDTDTSQTLDKNPTGSQNILN